MPTTVVLDPVGTRPPILTSPLVKDAVFALSWNFADLGQRQVLQQECSIKLSDTHALVVEVGPGLRKFSFRLSAGTHFDPAILSARVRARLLPHPPDPEVVEHSLAIQYPSALLPEREAMTAVYSELNQELRRMRTLYETFLVVVTGGFATLVSQANKILGSPTYRRWMGWGILVLAAIVAFLVWQVATRYNRTTSWLENLETALGLRVGTVPGPLMTDEVPRWRTGHRGHFVWALMLMVYTVMLGILAVLLLRTPLSSPCAQTQPSSPLQQQGVSPPPSPPPAHP